MSGNTRRGLSGNIIGVHPSAPPFEEVIRSMRKKAFKDLLEYIKNNTCEVSEDDGIVSLNFGGGVSLFYFKWDITYFDIGHDDFGVDWDKFYRASDLVYDLGFGWRHILMSLKIRKFVKEKRRDG